MAGKGERSTASGRPRGPLSLSVEPFEERHVEEVRSFNARLDAHGAELHERLGGAALSRLPETVVPQWLPPAAGEILRQEQFVVVDQDGVIRGGVTLKFQEYLFRGEPGTMALFQEPVSEAILDRRYGSVALRLLGFVSKREPHLYCSGMGGLDNPLPRFLSGMRWSLALSGFQFRIHKPFRFLRGLRYLRGKPARAAAMDVAAFSGAGWAGVRAVQGWRSRRRPPRSAYRFTLEREFGSWCDAVWERSKDAYTMVAVRTAAVQRRLFPNPDLRFERDIGACYGIVRVESEGATVGWALVMRSRMIDNSFFGNLQVGSIVDCLARPEDASRVAAAATDYLDSEGVDLTYTNQFSSAWQQAFSDQGYFSGPSNFGLAMAPRSVERLGAFEEALPGIHYNRGDGEGPVHRATLATQELLPPTALT